MADEKKNDQVVEQNKEAAPTQASPSPAPATKKGDKKKIIIIVIAVILVIGIAGIAMNNNKSSDNGSSSSDSASATAQASKTDSRYNVTIDSARTATEYGKKIIIVTYTFTNNSDKETSFTVAIGDKAYQNGVQLSRAVSSSADTQKALSNIQPGVTVTLEEAYQLDDSSEVTVKCTDQFDFSSKDEVLAEKNFSVE